MTAGAREAVPVEVAAFGVAALGVAGTAAEGRWRRSAGQSAGQLHPGPPLYHRPQARLHLPRSLLHLLRRRPPPTPTPECRRPDCRWPDRRHCRCHERGIQTLPLSRSRIQVLGRHRGNGGRKGRRVAAGDVANGGGCQVALQQPKQQRDRDERAGPRARIRMVGQTAQCVRAEVDPRPGAAQPHDRPKTPWEQSSRRAGRAWRALGGGRRALDGGRRAAWSVGCPRRWSRPGSAATVGAAWSASALCALHHASCPPRHPVWAPDLAPPLFPRARAPCAREERRRGLSNSTRWAMESTMQPDPPRRELAGRFQDLHRDLRGAGGRGRRGGGGVYAGAHRFNQGTTCFFFPPIPAPPQGSHWGS